MSIAPGDVRTPPRFPGLLVMCCDVLADGAGAAESIDLELRQP